MSSFRVYASVEEWLSEQEGFACRKERLPDGALPWVQTAWQLAKRADGEIEALRARVSALEEGLRPFYGAEGDEWMDAIPDEMEVDMVVKVGDLRRARALLSEAGNEPCS